MHCKDYCDHSFKLEKTKLKIIKTASFAMLVILFHDKSWTLEIIGIIDNA